MVCKDVCVPTDPLEIQGRPRGSVPIFIQTPDTFWWQVTNGVLSHHERSEFRPMMASAYARSISYENFPIASCCSLAHYHQTGDGFGGVMK